VDLSFMGNEGESKFSSIDTTTPVYSFKIRRFREDNFSRNISLAILLTRMSSARCLKDRFNTPLGPFTVTRRDLTVTVNPSGILTV